MDRYILSLGFLLSGFASTVIAVTPLIDQRFTYPGGVPYKVDTDDTGRGPQFGFTQCNSTTESQTSDCQLALLNSIDDFCIWGPPTFANISDSEAATVAWCTKPGHGTRVIPSGTLTGVQVNKAPSYILFSGTLKQENINIPADDGGGELDPHGDDKRGNPLGSLVYSNGFPSNNGNNNTFQQVIEWHNFMGSEVFCFKICDESVADSAQYCNNLFDRTGCDFVAPAAYQEGVFEVCESENMDPVGVYTGADGKTSTYKQPGESTEITSLPSVKTPSSSNCVPYTSSLLYAAAVSVTASGGSSSTTSAASTSTTGSSTASTSTGTSSSTTGSISKSSTTTSSKSTTATSSATSSGAARPGAPLPRVEMGPLVALAGAVMAGLGAVVVEL